MWVGLITLALVFEGNALRHPDRWPALSQTTRRVFRTDTLAGRAAFLAAWARLTAWYVPHVLRGPVPR